MLITTSTLAGMNLTNQKYGQVKRHGVFVAFYFYCKIMLISVSYNYCSILTANKCFNETELIL